MNTPAEPRWYKKPAAVGTAAGLAGAGVVGAGLLYGAHINWRNNDRSVTGNSISNIVVNVSLVLEWSRPETPTLPELKP